MSSPSRSPLENDAIATSKQDAAKGSANQDTAQGTLSQFEGPVQSSPYYKSLLTNGTEATSSAYNNVAANAKTAANKAGFNYTQPAATGAETEVQGQEAAALGSLPTKAAEAAAPLSVQAAQDTAGIGASQQATGLGYETGVAAPLENTYQNSQQNFWKSLSSIPGTVTGAFANL